MKTFTGEVYSVKMSDTAVVLVRQTKIHPLYKKRTVTVKKYHVHDIFGTQVGDQVEFVETKPFSKTKKWTITKVLNREVAPKEKEVRVVVDQPVRKNTNKNKRKIVAKSKARKGSKK